MESRRVPPLVEALAEVADRRRPRGRRHPLVAILSLACLAMLCNCDSLNAIAQWGRDQGAGVAARLGFTRARTPCVATLHRVFRRLDREQFEGVIGRWAERVCAAAGRPGALDAIALDGKTVRGSRTPDVPAVHLLSALSQRVGVTLAQAAVPDATNEIPTALEVLAGLVLEGRVVTVDALLTQRELAATVRQKGGTT
jgi:hypothetical protein